VMRHKRKGTGRKNGKYCTFNTTIYIKWGHFLLNFSLMDKLGYLDACNSHTAKTTEDI
jgi:hypothetical protein